jgi:DNA-binding cell septation regulator SpoVG
MAHNAEDCFYVYCVDEVVADDICVRVKKILVDRFKRIFKVEFHDEFVSEGEFCYKAGCRFTWAMPSKRVEDGKWVVVFSCESFNVLDFIELLSLHEGSVVKIHSVNCGGGNVLVTVAEWFEGDYEGKHEAYKWVITHALHA